MTFGLIERNWADIIRESSPETEAEFKRLYLQEWDMSMIDFESTFLRGDGRSRVSCHPDDVPPGTLPTPLSKASARLTVERFLKDGVMHHSGRGGIVWLLRRFCEETGTPYHYEAVHLTDGDRTVLAGFVSKIEGPHA